MNDRFASESAVCSAFNAVLSEVIIGYGRRSDEQLGGLFIGVSLFAQNYRFSYCPWVQRCCYDSCASTYRGYRGKGIKHGKGE